MPISLPDGGVVIRVGNLVLMRFDGSNPTFMKSRFVGYNSDIRCTGNVLNKGT